MAKLAITSYSNKAAPLKAHEQTVMVKVTAPVAEKKDTAPLDMVLVLDTSGSMAGDKIKKMKAAMEQVLKELRPSDRLAIVPFDSDADKTHATLQYASTTIKQVWKAFVHDLNAHGNTNIRAGLQVAVQVLLARPDRQGRTGVIFLMSDGEQNHGDAGKVDVSKVNVHTFGFGEKHDPKLLYALAHQSHGGAFHVVADKEDANHLRDAFLMMLVLFRSISILNLRVTLKKHEAAMENVDPGSYPMQKDGGGSYTIDFGDLGSDEKRRIILLLRLPVVPREEKATVVLTVECSYRIVGERKDTVGPKHQVHMERTAKANPGEMKPQVLTELLRRDHAASIEEARQLADKKKFSAAGDNLAHRLNALGKVDHSQEVVDFLTMEMEDILDGMGSHDQYEKLGKALALSALSSHARQRPTARGYVHDKPLFGTDTMSKYLAQARGSIKN